MINIIVLNIIHYYYRNIIYYIKLFLMIIVQILCNMNYICKIALLLKQHNIYYNNNFNAI